MKICDFGLATYITKELCEDITGTELYYSPELYYRRPYDYKVDIYGLGLIYLELCLGGFKTGSEKCKTFLELVKGNYSDDLFAELSNENVSH